MISRGDNLIIMRWLTLPFLLCIPALAASTNIIGDVRDAIAQKNFSRGEADIKAYRAQNGVTPQMLEALSWMGRGALAAKQLDEADRYADETRRLSLEQLTKTKLDAERHLPIALGASMEVHAHVLAARGQRSEAVAFLQQELKTYRDTSIRTRIQKNIHLLSLEGKPAPALETQQWLGQKPQPLTELKGRPVLLFFWAHWCGDCKRQAPDLARLMAAYQPKGLVLVGPTQHYGYTARGEDAGREQETRYIDDVRNQSYGSLAQMGVPLSEENFKNYGASTTPTLVLLDRKGLVRLYHPGNMPYAELAAKVAEVIAD
jgi:thiol-disulfide isomerase/thioredoxin